MRGLRIVRAGRDLSALVFSAVLCCFWYLFALVRSFFHPLDSFIYTRHMSPLRLGN